MSVVKSFKFCKYIRVVDLVDAINYMYTIATCIHKITLQKSNVHVSTCKMVYTDGDKNVIISFALYYHIIICTSSGV